MSDDIIKRLREAIAAGPTPGAWFHAYDFGQIGSVENEAGHVIVQAQQTAPGREDIDRRNKTAAFIAAASPENIAALLDRLDAAEAENERMRAVVSALAFQASRDPFVSVGHWCEHGPCAAIIRDISNPNADHHGPDWTERDSEYLK